MFQLLGMTVETLDIDTTYWLEKLGATQAVEISLDIGKLQFTEAQYLRPPLPIKTIEPTRPERSR